MTFQPQKDQKAAKLVYKAARASTSRFRSRSRTSSSLELRLTKRFVKTAGAILRGSPRPFYFSSLIRHVKIGRDAGTRSRSCATASFLLAAFGLALPVWGRTRGSGRACNLVSASRRFHEREAAMATLAQQRTPPRRGSAPGNAALRSRNPQASAGPSQRSLERTIDSEQLLKPQKDPPGTQGCAGR